MGIVLTPTADMNPWRTEVRSRSAYISGGRLRAHRHDGRDLHTGFAIPTTQARSLLAALDQILAHPAFPQDADGPGHWTEWTVDSGWLYLSGPCYVYGVTGTGWVPSTASVFEIDYSTMLAARNLLYAALTALRAEAIERPTQYEAKGPAVSPLRYMGDSDLPVLPQDTTG